MYYLQLSNIRAVSLYIILKLIQHTFNISNKFMMTEYLKQFLKINQSLKFSTVMELPTLLYGTEILILSEIFK